MPNKFPQWKIRAAEIMVAQFMSLRQAAQEISVPLSAEEAEKLERTKDFRNILESAKLRYMQDLADNPSRSKASTVGEMLWLCAALKREGQFEKALEGLFKVAKIEGWMGAETQINVLANLSQADIDAARKSLNLKTPKKDISNISDITGTIQ